MIRNDYKRALIMLRSLMNGYSGHARIEVRTLAGTLSALAGIPQGERSVHAALVGSHKGRYFAAPLGTLRRDMRGQAVMTANFDPRDINGRPLEAYSLLTLVEVTGDKQDIAMVGNMNGNVEVDWGKVRDTACALYRSEAQPVSELLGSYIEEQEGKSETQFIEQETTPKGMVSEQEIAEEKQTQEEGITREYAPAPEMEEIPESTTLPELPLVEEQPQKMEEIPESKTCPELPLVEEQPQEMGEIPESTTLPELPLVEEQPEQAEEMPPMQGEGWSFVKIPLLKGCGFPCTYIGVRCPGGAPDEICYALPARYTPEPPPGLDDYEWVGDSSEGWWLKCLEPISCE